MRGCDCLEPNIKSVPATRVRLVYSPVEIAWGGNTPLSLTSIVFVNDPVVVPERLLVGLRAAVARENVLRHIRAALQVRVAPRHRMAACALPANGMTVGVVVRHV